jgi:hypothetical protein
LRKGNTLPAPQHWKFIDFPPADVDDITKRLPGATFTAGVTEACECDQGSRARDWENRGHDLVSEEKAALQKGMNFSVRIGVGKEKPLPLEAPAERTGMKKDSTA